MTGRRLIFFLGVFVFIAVGGIFLVQFAKGYRFDFGQKSLHPTGLLVATSSPDGAEIYIDGKLKSATNTTIYLTPDKYEVEIKKDGFQSWKKSLTVEAEMVTKAEAWLFPIVPNFQALTYTGAQNPLPSPDSSKVVYKVIAPKMPEKQGLWVIDLSELPFGISREPKQIVKNTPKRDFARAQYSWSPDSRQIIVTFNQGTNTENYLLDPGGMNLNETLLEATLRLPGLIRQWDLEEDLKKEQKLTKLPLELVKILKEDTNEIFFSPDETKILYTASKSASIPEKLIPPVHSFSNQPEVRELKENQTYVYDLKEDRNYLILEGQKCQVGNRYFMPENPTPTPTPKTTKKSKITPTPKQEQPECTLRWVPNSRHLLLSQKDQIYILEFEGTNKTKVFEGNYLYPFAYIFQAANKLLVLTPLLGSKDSEANLYAVSLR